MNSNLIEIVMIQFIKFIKLIGKAISGRKIPVPLYRVIERFVKAIVSITFLIVSHKLLGSFM